MSIIFAISNLTEPTFWSAQYKVSSLMSGSQVCAELLNLRLVSVEKTSLNLTDLVCALTVYSFD